ncbi:MAG: energy-coupling factor transporter ATPase [Chloroflexota bacterium]|nr:energy-coupling factor transporter ATPase [Chloroflexota bacterium]
MRSSDRVHDWGEGVIDVVRLGFKYVGRRRPTLRDVSFTVRRGESLLVLGPSGCGKSTLALGLNGAIPHAVGGDLSGSVRVDGVDTGAATMGDLARRVGIVFQDPEAQFCMLTVEDEVAFGLENLAVPRAEMDARIDEALAAVGLGHHRRDRIARLSGGQKQRLALACVLAMRPEVIVCDEPTAQLDPAGAADVIALLGKLRRSGDHSLVIVEHRLDEVMHLVDRVLVLSADGELVADGPPREVLRAHAAWLAEAGVWVPQVSELALGLERRGFVVRPFPLTVAEAAAALGPVADRLVGERPGATMVGAAALADGPHRNGALAADAPTPVAGVWPEGDRLSDSVDTPPGAPVPLVAFRPVAGHTRAPVPNGTAPALATNGAPPASEPDEYASAPLVDVRGLTYRYPRAETPALRDVSFSLRAGELVAVVGGNGAGKSTLARLLAGILRPPREAVRLRCRDVAAIPPADLARDVGYVFQYPEHQFVGATVLDDVAYGPRRLGMPEAAAQARARSLLADFGLSHLEAAHPFTLSHGEQRRLSVASMLVLGQSILLLDEPTFGQDKRNATMLLDQLEALAARGRTLVVVSHDMRMVAERARRVLVLADGALIFDGPPAGLFADAALLQRARLTPPPLWDLSRRLGLPAPLVRADDVLPFTSNADPFAGEAVGGRPA